MSLTCQHLRTVGVGPRRDGRNEPGGVELPGVIAATKDGMVSSFTTMAVVATLLASTEGVFLSIIKSSSQSPSSEPRNTKVMVILTYLAIIFNIGASWSALRMIDALGKMPFLVAQYNTKRMSVGKSVEQFDLEKVRDVAQGMRKYGLSGIWSFFAWHCSISLFLGSLCVLAQILLYTWINEDAWVSIAVTVLAFITSIPIFLSLFM
ncbi:hypothetical protein M407DRAFT_160710 [Tulasnella calospora MUT 4182]|uniref:Uncharacterized protein n=1 Tax=Tulasnella calospora MUT 4182 TaxID=1051891 RepID=A0A0C3PU00_9AGAM|nr:hypothetical protein M407DRAFT_160710 [Tulasnella calospora MUT 4182]